MNMPWLSRLAVAACGVGVVALVQTDEPATRWSAAPSSAPSSSSRPERTIDDADPLPGAPPAAALATRRSYCVATPGARAGWLVQSKTTYTGGAVGMSSADLEGLKVASFTSELQVEAMKSSPSGTVLVARWTHTGPEMLRLVAEFEAPFLIELDAACSLVRFARGQTVDQASARAQQVALWELSFRVPESDTQQWQSRSGVGVFESVLTLKGDAARSATVERRVTQFTHAWGSPSLPTLGVNLLAAQVGDTFWFSRLTSFGEVAFDGLASGSTELDARSVVAPGSALAAASRNEADYVWEDLLPAVRSNRPSFAARTPAEVALSEQLARASYDEAMLRFAQTAEQTTEVMELHRDLALYLERRPDTVRLLLATIREDVFAEQVKPAVFMAMQVARNPTVREALVDLVKDESLLPMDRVRAGLALAGRPDVGDVESRELLSIAQSGIDSPVYATRFVAENALLAAGVLAGMSGSPSLGSGVRSLAARHVGSSNRFRRRLAFRAIGNLGDVADLELVRRVSQSADVEARADACRALRRLTPEQAGSFELDWLARETSPEVTGEVWYVLMEQLLDAGITHLPEAYRQLAIAHLRAQYPVATRQTLLKLLVPLMDVSPQARAAVLEQAVVEFRTKSGLFNFIAANLTTEEFLRVTAAGRRSTPPTASRTAPAVSPSVPFNPSQLVTP